MTDILKDAPRHHGKVAPLQLNDQGSSHRNNICLHTKEPVLVGPGALATIFTYIWDYLRKKISYLISEE